MYYIFSTISREVVQRNWDSILKFSAERISNGGCYDISHEQARTIVDFSSTKLVIPQVLSTDGVSIVDSSDQEIWPIWLAFCQPPLKLRMSQKNIVPAALHTGNGKPNWEKIVPHIESELQTSIKIENNMGQSFDFSFKEVFLVADLIT